MCDEVRVQAKTAKIIQTRRQVKIVIRNTSFLVWTQKNGEQLRKCNLWWAGVTVSGLRQKKKKQACALEAYSFLKKKINWRMITLQYHGGFCHISTWISHVCSPSWNARPTPSPSHPSGSSQRTSPEHPVLCIEPGLAICFTYGNIHVSMLCSQIIPPSPSPTEPKSLFLTSVSLLLSCI